VWGRIGSTLTIAGTTPVQEDLLGILKVQLGAGVLGSTVSRVRLTMGAARTAGSTVTANFFVGVKVGDSLVEAVDQDPSTATGLDWMFWRKCFMAEDNAGGALASLHANAWEFDIKAMRKMQEVGQTLWLVLGNADADSFTVQYGASVLLLLP